jgi:hypothetical protein
MRAKVLVIAVPVLAILALLGATACGSAEPRTPQVDLDDLTTDYACGYGFQAGNTEQTVAIFLTPDPPGSPPSTETADLGADSAWSGEIRVGRDLFATWCSDILVMGEPEPVVDETWALVDGVLAITDVGDDENATMTATGLVAVDPSGARHELGDVVLVNAAWGMFAG